MKGVLDMNINIKLFKVVVSDEDYLWGLTFGYGIGVLLSIIAMELLGYDKHEMGLIEYPLVSPEWLVFSLGIVLSLTIIVKMIRFLIYMRWRRSSGSKP